MSKLSRSKISAISLSIAAATLVTAGACSDATGPATGSLSVKLTDAPFSSDSVSRVDVYVVRVDAKTAESDSSEAVRAVSDDSVAAGGWTTVATPNRSIELLALRNGISTTLGLTTVPVGSYRSFRLVIDPSKSSVTLKNGAVLTSTSTPNVSFPSASRSGIKVKLDRPVAVDAGGSVTALIDFDVSGSFEMRSGSIATGGLIFKPVVRGTVQ
jgi:hypothetical protein